MTTDRLMSPRAAVVQTIFVVVAIVSIDSYPLLWFCSAVQLLLFLILLRSPRTVRLGIYTSMAFTLPLLVIHGLLNPTFEEVKYTFLGLPIHNDGLEFAATIGGRLSLVSNLGVSLSLVSGREAIEFLHRVRVPQAIVLTIAMSFSFLRDVYWKSKQVFDAQRARGIPVTGNVFQRLFALPSVVVPVIISTLVDSQRRALCLKTRGFDLDRTSIESTANWPKGVDILQITVESSLGSATLSKGSAVEWTAPAASGKTLLSIKMALGDSKHNQVRHSYREGLQLPYNCLPRYISWVPTDVRHMISGIAQTVADELELKAFDPISDCKSNNLRKSLLTTWGLDKLADRHPFTLSGGEQAKLALAIAVNKNPEILILDQAGDALDAESKTALDRYVDHQCKSGGIGVCRFMNRSARDRSRGYITCIETEDRPKKKNNPQPFEALHLNSDSCLQANSLSFSYRGGFALQPFDLHLSRGEICFLTGRNGSGKTTLLKVLSLLLQSKGSLLAINPETGRMELPPKKRKRHLWAKRVALSFQNPSDQIFCPTVEEEVSRSANSMADSDAAMAVFGLSAVRSENPLDLPLPFQRMVALASVISMRSPVFLFDEPTVLLDDTLLGFFEDALHLLRQAGHASLIVTHDTEFQERISGRTLVVERGRVTEIA